MNYLPRFIDTSELQSLLAKGRVFQDEVASVTGERIQERIRGVQNSPLATYQPQRDTMLRQITQEVVQYIIYLIAGTRSSVNPLLRHF